MTGVDRSSTNPVECDEAEGQRSGKDTRVGDLAGLGVFKVGKRQLEEVDDYEQQSPAEERAAPQVDEPEYKEIVCNKVGGEVACRGESLLSARLSEEAGKVWNLEDVEGNP